MLNFELTLATNPWMQRDGLDALADVNSTHPNSTQLNPHASDRVPQDADSSRALQQAQRSAFRRAGIGSFSRTARLMRGGCLCAVRFVSQVLARLAEARPRPCRVCWRQSRHIMSASGSLVLGTWKSKKPSLLSVSCRAASLGQEEPHGHATLPHAPSQRETSKRATAR